MSRRPPRFGVKRVYEPTEASDGTRVLVDRIWPRGFTKEHASVDVWLKDIAPSAGLRTWFGHDPNRWREFHKRYFEELCANHAAVERLTDLVSTGKVTLLFGAHDTERNNAVALADYLAPLVGVDVRDRKLAQVVFIACRRPDADVIVRADVGAEAERPPDGTHVRSLHQLGALLVAKVSFEPDGALEGVAAAIPAMVVRHGYLDVGQRDFPPSRLQPYRHRRARGERSA
jgi:uncharacterized protein YeaO (DUF488 family)